MVFVFHGQFHMFDKKMNLRYIDSERNCECRFNEIVTKYGRIWHVCTPGNLQEIINVSEEDFKFAVSNTAISAAETGIRILTDAQMDNHIHVLIAGSAEGCQLFIQAYKYRLGKYLENKGRHISLKHFGCDSPIPVDTLEMARNEIAYINRNGFVADRKWTPFTYPWGSGYLYFNPSAQSIKGTCYNNLPFLEKRALSYRRIASMPDCYTVFDGMVLPSGYADVKSGETLFRDAHHYMVAVTRNFEAYSEEAKRLGDRMIVDDEELYNVVKMIGEKEYRMTQPSLLSPSAKIEVAKKLHSDYNATNVQIRRILKLPLETVDALFPLNKSTP